VSLLASLPELVLDAWPVLEWIKGREPTCTAFHHIVEDAIGGRLTLRMSRINHGEVIYSIWKAFPPERVLSALEAFAQIPITLHSVDDALVDEAVKLKSVYAISYADAFAVALSARLSLPLVSGDHELRGIALRGFQLHWIGK